MDYKKISLSLPGDIYLEADVTGFHPSRPAPACSDHDSPAFSDSGDDAEADEVILYFVVEREVYDRKEKKNINKISRYKVPSDMTDEIFDGVWDEIVCQCEEKYFDMRENHADF